MSAAVQPIAFPMAQVALQYLQRGWRVLPIPYMRKGPVIKGWQNLRLSEAELPDRFRGYALNIGVLLGEPSNWLVDVDIDHPRAVELADRFLPPTGLVFGRPGKPRSHRLYRVTGAVASKKFASKTAGMLVELRSTRTQTVFPPSTHPSGEKIQWEDAAGEPAEIEPRQLHEALRQLASAVLAEWGEEAPQPPRRTSKRQRIRQAQHMAAAKSDAPPAERCLKAMLAMRMVDSQDGSGRLFAAACRAVEHGLDDNAAIQVIREYAAQRPFPTEWSDDEIVQRLRDAQRKTTPGAALEDEADPLATVPLGERDPDSGRWVLSPKKTLPTAQAYLQEFHTHPEGHTLRAYADEFWHWRGNRYVKVEEGAIRGRLLRWLHKALRYGPPRDGGPPELEDFESNPHTVKAALETLRAHTHLSAELAPPRWLDDPDSHPAPQEIVACRSSLLHLPTMTRWEPTPSLFNVNALDFDHDPHAGTPDLWLQFLHQLLDGDLESLDLLQEWFGYSLVGDTSQQKMLLIVGPKRSGKGTIARVLRRLVGETNVCGPTASSLAGNFGLQPLLGKSLAIVSDARFHGDNILTTVERLLCISGEDALTVDRKHLPSVTLTLPLRFLFLSNELPRFNDASGALAGRFLILRLTESFYGREDTRLSEKLCAELPGILNWAIEGWRRLHERGHFVMPSDVQDVVRDMEDLASPVGAFVREECVVGSEARVYVSDLYEHWVRWCEQEGRFHISAKQTFCRDLLAVVPTAVTRRNHSGGRFYSGIGLRAATHIPAGEGF